MGDWIAITMIVVATGYCPCSTCCGQHADGLTASGRDARTAGIAVDSSVIPLGSRVDIPGYARGPNSNGSWIPADDTGNPAHITGNRIDIRFRSHVEARQWGKRKIRIRVWKRK